MTYITTRNSDTTYSLRQAAFAGLAPDGGLFVPGFVPRVSMEEVCGRAAGGFAELAEYLAGLFFADDLSTGELHDVCAAAFNFPVPLVRVGSANGYGDRLLQHEGGVGADESCGDFNVVDHQLFTLELFHGPTCAFKDFGARFMAQMFARLRPANERLTILTATSGDTGGAVADAFLGIDGIEVVVLYPAGKVSDLQERQMATLGGNIRAVAVEGTFDDCQRMVKEVFADAEFRDNHNVTSANSINILRWIPQSFYYFWGVAQWWSATGGEDFTGYGSSLPAPAIVVPSGNYGNLSAGMLARAMGLPIERLIAASNANDVVPEWLASGVYRPRPSVTTVANAMDVGAPSNYERMNFLTDGNFEVLRSEVAGYSFDDQSITGGIRELYDRFGYVSDPHSAAGFNTARDCGLDGFWLSTASAAKFGEVIEPVLGFEPLLPASLLARLGRPILSHPMPPDSKALREFIGG